MSNLESLQRQIATVQELQSVVKTMKVLAAASIRQYERAVESLAEYTRTIEMGLQVVLGECTRAAEYQHQTLTLTAAESIGHNRLGAIVFGSDQGMCGQFNEQIAHYAATQIDQHPIPSANQALLAVGVRVIPPLEALGKAIAAEYPMPSSLAGITPMVQELLLQIELWRSKQQIGRIILFYNQLRSNTSCEPHMMHLLPIDQTWLQRLQQKPWHSRTLPTFTMDSSQLISALIGQYFFVSLYRAVAESLASENASRLASMQVAEQNIEERLADFNTQFQQQRQTSITEEILEIVSGFEVLTQQSASSNMMSGNKTIRGESL